MTNSPLVIYHGFCPDGFASALAAWLWFTNKRFNTKGFKNNEISDAAASEVTFLAARHGDEVPDCANRHVYLLDFCYDEQILQSLCGQAAKVTVIDHHISMLPALESLQRKFDSLKVIFNNNHSAAVLSWQYFFNTEPPELFKFIEDRDIWKFEYAATKNIMAAVVSWPYEFSLWQSWLDNPDALSQLEKDGTALNRVRDAQIRRYAKNSLFGEIAGYRVPVVNAPGFLVSDLLAELAEGVPFAASYEDRNGRRYWQLRSSRTGGIDVSEIAASFGGGGHKHASGFSQAIDSIIVKP